MLTLANKSLMLKVYLHVTSMWPSKSRYFGGKMGRIPILFVKLSGKRIKGAAHKTDVDGTCKRGFSVNGP